MNTDREVPVELAVQNVSVAYNNGHVALYDASFRLQKGTITALVGVNGRRAPVGHRRQWQRQVHAF